MRNLKNMTQTITLPATTPKISAGKLEQLRMAVGLHFSYGYRDAEASGLRYRLKRFFRVFGVPLADTVTDRQALAAAAFIWERYVPAVRVAVFNPGPDVLVSFSRHYDDPADILYVVAVSVQAEVGLQTIARERLRGTLFEPIWNPPKQDPID